MKFRFNLQQLINSSNIDVKYCDTHTAHTYVYRDACSHSFRSRHSAVISFCHSVLSTALLK